MNNDNFLIESSDIELARDLCKYITDPDLRNRSVANALAAKIATKYFDAIDVDTTSGLHNVIAVHNDLEISDIYVKDAYIDVRLYFNDNELCVPKSHFDKDVLPVAYMFIKIDETLSSGIVTGFITPSAINTSIEYKGYYGVKEEELQSFYDIEPLLYTEPFDDIPENFETQIFDYLDNKLEDTSSFYKVLINSRDYRLFLINSAKAQIIFNFISPEIKENKEQFEATSDNSLNIEDNKIEDIATEEPFADLELSAEESDSLEEFEVEDISLENSSIEYEALEDSDSELLPDFDTDVTSELEEFDITEDIDNGELSISDMEESSELEELEAVETNEFEDYAGDDSEIDTEGSSIENFESVDIEEKPELDNSTESIEIEQTLDIVEGDFGGGIPNEETFEGNYSDESYSTNITPSLETIDSDQELQIDDENNEEIFDEIAQQEDLEDINSFIEEEQEQEENVVATESEESSSSIYEETQIEEETSAEIDELFGDQENIDNSEDYTQVQRKKSGLLPMLGVLTVIAAIGYFGYTKISSTADSTQNEQPVPIQTVAKQKIDTPEQNISKDAMPIETVENIKQQDFGEEGNAVSIPAIEKNLDASILVSNLSVNWEVPSGYVNNPSAKRYFVKIGKIIQLNLKTELLLLSKPPITNKIAVELEFNKASNRFQVKQITSSSGEKSIDELITKTINGTLDLNLSTNMNIYSNIQGNPVLIIRL